MNIKSRLFIDHIVLTIRDIGRTKDFYTKIFGAPDYQDADSVLYLIGETKLFFTLPHGTPFPHDRFDANRVGLEHFAIGLKTIDDLKEIEQILDSGSIPHSGIHIDKHSKKEKIWLDDPDKIRVEFFIS
ncbi:MAG: VOC family protein [Puia sp.]|nr:VOC family protein [Puia sp.]